MDAGKRQEEEFIHLIRLAWDLRRRGLGTAVELAPRKDPVLLVPRPSGSLRVMALRRKGVWFFTWGRGESRRVRALADDAADHIWGAAQ